MSAYHHQNKQLGYWWECSSRKSVRELGSKRCKSVWSISLIIHTRNALFSQYARTRKIKLKLNLTIQWYHCFKISDLQHSFCGFNNFVTLALRASHNSVARTQQLELSSQTQQLELSSLIFVTLALQGQNPSAFFADSYQGYALIRLTTEWISTAASHFGLASRALNLRLSRTK